MAEKIMRKKLDPECLGIILLSDFLYEFFPEDQKSVPDTFDLMHYNGISNSNADCKVKYHKGMVKMVIYIIYIDTPYLKNCRPSCWKVT